MALKQLSKIDDRTKFAVYGWIREQERTDKLRNIPAMIVAICILYFRNDEVFDIIADDVRVSDNKKRLEPLRSAVWRRHNYGINEIASDSNWIYQWDFRIIQGSWTQFGIASSTHINKNKNKRMESGIYYLFCSESKRHNKLAWDSISISVAEGDVISMILDLRKAQIKLIVDDKEEIVYRDIKKSRDIKYRLVVSFYYIQGALEILNFSRK